MKKETGGEFQYHFGRMIKGIHSILLKENQISDSQNMVPGYQGWKQRKGMSELTTTAVASSLRFKSMLHFRDLKGDTSAIMAHVYDASNGERVMKQTTLPPSTHLGNTWTEMYDLTASCENAQFAIVAGSLIAANNKEFLAWRGEKYLPSGVWFYDGTSYINYFDECTDNNASTSMPLNSMSAGNGIYLTGPMPMNKVVVDVGNVNGNDVWLIGEYWNSAWMILRQASWWSDDNLGIDTCGDATAWTDSSSNGSSSFVTLHRRTCVKMDSGAAGAGNHGGVIKDFGNHSGYTVAATILVFFDNIGAKADGDDFRLYVNGDGVTAAVAFSTSGTHVYDGASWVEADNTAYAEDQWYTITVVGDFSVGGSETCSVYVNGSLVCSGEDCSWATGTDGVIQMKQAGDTTANQITYVAYAVVGDALDATGDSFSDGTYSSGTLAQDGNITWTAPGDETKTLIDGIPGYAVRFAPSAALDAAVSILDIDIHSPMSTVRALWSGEYMTPTGCYVYDGTDHTDYTLYVGNTAESQYMDLSGVTTTDKIYVGFPYRTNQVFFLPSSDGKNASNVSITAVKYFASDGTWTSVGTVTDTMETNNATFSQKGSLSWADPGKYAEKPVKVGGDEIPWFWYEITVDAALDAATYIYHINAVPIDDDPDYCFGCFGWKRRAWQIAPLNLENQVRYSAQNQIDVWGGPDSGYIEFGERPLKTAAPFYNETVLFADTEMWMLQGNSPSNFGRLRLSANIGTAAPHGVVMVEAGVSVGESIKNVIVWPFYDGFWMFDGVRVFKISSPDIDSFFDSGHDDYINPAYLDETQGVFDHETQCIKWTVYSGSSATTPTKVIVLHFPTLWYGIFDYGTDIGPMCKVWNNKYYSVGGGNASGKTYLLNDGVTDVNASGTAVAVDAYIITRDMFASYSDGLQQRLLSVWTEAQEAGGMIEIDEYPDGSKTPQNFLKKDLTWFGKIFGLIQKPLKDWKGQASTKFRLRNRSKNARMNLLGFSTTIDKGRADE